MLHCSLTNNPVLANGTLAKHNVDIHDINVITHNVPNYGRFK